MINQFLLLQGNLSTPQAKNKIANITSIAFVILMIISFFLLPCFVHTESTGEISQFSLWDIARGAKIDGYTIMSYGPSRSRYRRTDFLGACIPIVIFVCTIYQFFGRKDRTANVLQFALSIINFAELWNMLFSLLTSLQRNQFTYGLPIYIMCNIIVLALAIVKMGQNVFREQWRRML